MMADLTKPLMLALAFGLAAPVWAQDNTTPAAETPAAESPAADAPTADAPATGSPATDLSLGAPAAGSGPDAIGKTYTAETHGDWQLQCVRTENGDDPCQIYQLMKDADGNAVADISLFGLPGGQQAAAGATIMTPLETLLTQQITIKVDAADAKVYPFTFCAQMGCFARVGFTAAEIEGFKKGNKATITVVPMAAPDQKVAVNMSLKGFTAAYEAVLKANEPTK